MEQKEPISLKMMLVGETQTGKTQIIRRFVGNQFSTAYQSAFINFESKKFTDRQGKLFKLQLWDACGQHQTSILSYLQAVNIIGLVVDGSRPLEAAKLAAWLLQIKKTALESVLICMIVNKVDLMIRFDEVHENSLTRQLKAVLKANGYDAQSIPIFYCSAKTGQGIHALFYTMASYFAKAQVETIKQNRLTQIAPIKATVKINEDVSHNIQLSPTFWNRISGILSQHKFFIGGNGILILAAVMLSLALAFPAVGCIALGLSFSAMTIALVMIGIMLVVFNTGYAMHDRFLLCENNDDSEVLTYDQAILHTHGSFSLPAKEMTENAVQTRHIFHPQTQHEEIRHTISTFKLQ